MHLIEIRYEYNQNEKSFEIKELKRKKQHREGGKKFILNYYKELEGANKKTITEYKEYIRSTKIGKQVEKEAESC